MIRDDCRIDRFLEQTLRDAADDDYVSARQSGLINQWRSFGWSGLQAIEKYLKALLVFHRISVKTYSHDLKALFSHCNEKLPFNIALKSRLHTMLQWLDQFGIDRYRANPFQAFGVAVADLDELVWIVRNHCVRVYSARKDDESYIEAALRTHQKALQIINDRKPDLSHINGRIEWLLSHRKHPSRAALIRYNHVYNKRHAKRVRSPTAFEYNLGPLSEDPCIIHLVKDFVKVSKIDVSYYEDLCSRGFGVIRTGDPVVHVRKVKLKKPK